VNRNHHLPGLLTGHPTSVDQGKQGVGGVLVEVAVHLHVIVRSHQGDQQLALGGQFAGPEAEKVIQIPLGDGRESFLKNTKQRKVNNDETSQHSSKEKNPQIPWRSFWETLLAVLVKEMES